jgi:4-amino-4-deoxychorismate lyase
VKTRWLVNGLETGIHPSDRGLAYGDGLFETMAASGGDVHRLDRHLRRLARDCERLRIPCPDLGLLEREIRAACPASGRAVVKLIVTRGPGARGYRAPASPEPTRILAVAAWPDYPPSHYTRGIDVMLCEIRASENPMLAGMKHLNRLEQVLAQFEIAARGADEGLMLGARDNVIGGSMSNLFMVKDEALTTPALNDAGVAGIMREVVLEHASARGFETSERRLAIAELREADEIFVTNSVFGVWPVRRLDGRRYRVGPVTRELMHALELGPHA